MDQTKNKNNSKFSAPDLIYNNMYLVRFRCGLSSFFDKMRSFNNLEIILWTAAVRKVYTGLMDEVHSVLSERLNVATPLWSDILFRDNCTVRENGSYFKDLSLLGRDMKDVVMIDNKISNFHGFEDNGLPINEYW